MRRTIGKRIRIFLTVWSVIVTVLTVAIPPGKR